MHNIMRCNSCILPLLSYKTSFGHSNTFAQERMKLARYILLCVAITYKYACHQTHERRVDVLYSWTNYNIIANIELLFIIVFFCLPILNIYYTYIYILARTPNRWNRTNPNFEQTQTLNKPKLRTNPNFEQTQTSNKPKLRIKPNFGQT